MGVTLDGQSLASSAQGMMHMVRTFYQAVQCPLYQAFRMASLTPAKIAGMDHDCGSLTPGKRADLLLLDDQLQLQQTWVAGIPFQRT